VESGRLGFFELRQLEVFIDPTIIIVVGCSFLLTGTPDSPVCNGHWTIHCPVPATLAVRWIS
jgi:hypothetical protein